jgi:hypothetical protein
MRSFNKVISAILAIAVLSTFNFSATTIDRGVAGEILVSGAQSGVSVNGAVARSGRAVANGSQIATGPNSTATVSVNGLGSLKLGPNSSFRFNFDETGLSGALSKGEVEVLEAEGKVAVVGMDGQNFDLGAGEKASTDNSKAHDDGTSFASRYWWLWVVIIGGAITGIVVAASGDDQTVSPNR